MGEELNHRGIEALNHSPTFAEESMIQSPDDSMIQSF